MKVDVSAADRVWITAKVITPDGKQWELTGVFSSRERAVAACREWNFCVWPMRLDECSPEETIVHPEAFYPVPRVT